MNIDNFLCKMKEIQSALLNLFNAEKDKEIAFHLLIDLLENQKIGDNQKELKLFFHLLLVISKNHHRSPDFFNYIEKLLLVFKDKIQNYFPEWEIFTIFKGNKRILLFLIKEKIITVDQLVQDDVRIEKYCNYFFPEMKEHLSKEKVDEISKNLSENFESNRQIGENDSYLCQLIRNDSVDEFIAYCNQTNVSFKETLIKPSIFETNSFLLKNKEISLIEYAAFFGSINVFQSLKVNNVNLTPSLWLYAIHGNNNELIHKLEEYDIEPVDKTYNECFLEAIKCHHNNIANYIKDNLMKSDEKNESSNHLSSYLEYYNFAYIQKDIINESIFNHLCRFDYEILVENLLKNGNIDLNSKVIYCFYFHVIFISIFNTVSLIYFIKFTIA